jgi:hypothetical protein
MIPAPRRRERPRRGALPRGTPESSAARAGRRVDALAGPGRKQVMEELACLDFLRRLSSDMSWDYPLSGNTCGPAPACAPDETRSAVRRMCDGAWMCTREAAGRTGRWRASCVQNIHSA